MSEAKYTRGPWKAYEDGLDCWTVVDSDKEDVCHLACVGDEANANLIAAAPELLEAAFIGLGIATTIGEEYGDMSAAKKIRAAIAKALGSENAD